jgi:DNA invertase Pin-like site-specific DNA recombinase
VRTVAVVEDEVANEGRAAAKANGRRFGRKPKLDEHQQAEALQWIGEGENFRAIARRYRVSTIELPVAPPRFAAARLVRRICPAQ